MKVNLFILMSFLLLSCQHIETGDTLDASTIGLIRKMGMLEDDEKIIKFYSNYEKDKAGNFYTDKRIAHYWLDSNDSSKNERSFAFYTDIESIDTSFNVQDFDIPYMKIRKKDGSVFKVFVDGKPIEKKAFFEDAIDIWKKSR